MLYPKFIQTQDQREQLSNLMINCENAASMFEGLFSMWLEQPNGQRIGEVSDLHTVRSGFVLVQEYSLLSPYYFRQSKNDAANELKALLTRTYSSRREYHKPLMGA